MPAVRVVDMHVVDPEHAAEGRVLRGEPQLAGVLTSASIAYTSWSSERTPPGNMRSTSASALARAFSGSAPAFCTMSSAYAERTRGSHAANSSSVIGRRTVGTRRPYRARSRVPGT
jgi:hypothetical protein